MFESNIKREWMIDSLGCEGKRNHIVNKNIKKIKSFKNHDFKDFYDNFGKSNDIKKNKYGNKIHIYWIDCSLVPKYKFSPNHKESKKRINYEMKMLLVEVALDSTIISLNLIEP